MEPGSRWLKIGEIGGWRAGRTALFICIHHATVYPLWPLPITGKRAVLMYDVAKFPASLAPLNTNCLFTESNIAAPPANVALACGPEPVSMTVVPTMLLAWASQRWE